MITWATCFIPCNLKCCIAIYKLLCLTSRPKLSRSFFVFHDLKILQKKTTTFHGLFSSGILSLKFPETATVKAATLFFVSWEQQLQAVKILKKIALFISFLCTRQTELLPRCKDMPLLGEVLQEDGKLLTETLLQVSQTQLSMKTSSLNRSFVNSPSLNQRMRFIPDVNHKSVF